MKVRVLNALKWDGERHEPGTVLEMPEEVVTALPRGTVRPLTVEPPPPAPRAPRTLEERKAEIREAQKRVAVVTGDKVPEEGSTPATEPQPATTG